MNDGSGGDSDLKKTPREKWYSPKVSSLADSANEKDVDTIKFKKYMDEIKSEGIITAKVTEQEFSRDIRNVSIMIKNKNIVKTWITDLTTDIEKDVKNLNDELENKYKVVVNYHNDRQLVYNNKAEEYVKENAKNNSTSDDTWYDEFQE